MVHFLCKKCNKSFSKKDTYQKHIKRKYPCDRNMKMCLHCSKRFSTCGSCNRHMKKCTNIANIDIIDDNVGTINNNLQIEGDIKVVKFNKDNLTRISNDLFQHMVNRGLKMGGEIINHSHLDANNQGKLLKIE